MPEELHVRTEQAYFERCAGFCRKNGKGSSGEFGDLILSTIVKTLGAPVLVF